MPVAKNETLFVEVGRSCLKDFLCTEKIESILWSATFTQTISDILSEGRETGGRVNPVYALELVLGCAIHSVNEIGYITKKRAMEDEVCSTAGEAMYLLNGDRYNNVAPYEPTEAELDEARKIIAFVKEANTNNDYMFNLVKIAQAEYTTGLFVGYAVSMIPYYRRERATILAQQKKAQTPSEFIGEVGKRCTFDLTFVNFFTFEGFYGVTYIYKFTDVTGNVVIWKTTSAEEFVQGEEVKMVAMVKAHEVYKDHKGGTTNQTIVNRPKFTK